MEYGLLLDLAVLAVILGSGVLAWRVGFVRAALGFLPMLAATIGTKLLTPYTGKFLRETALSASIGDSMGLDATIQEGAMSAQTQFIESLKLPAFLKEALLENNNPVIYQLLDVNSLKEYIAGYLANICINILSVVLAFVLLYITVKLLLNALHLVSQLPVLHFINHAAGLVVGTAKGLLMVWLGCIILTFFQCNAKFTALFAGLEQSFVAGFLYENNILLQMILTIFT